MDDGSADNSPAVIERYAELDPRIRFCINSSNQGLPRNRNIGISISRGDLVFFIEDDLVLERDCLRILVETYMDLAMKNKVGAVAPRLMEKYFFNYNKRKMDELGLPFMFDKRTGEIYTNYSEDFGEVQKVVTVHACSLYSMRVLEEVGGFEERAYRGTYGREEVDLNFRLKRRGYKFYFQPKAVAYHKRVSYGGCSTSSLHAKWYNFVRNHVVFVVRIFGVKSMYMIPLFLLNTMYKTMYIAICGLQKDIAD